ncbi:MAG: GntR family transcriptional regulator [Phormidesmis priestleyi Ana]|uniref:GntR family transcriptional regulator n=1 Tax=Phormidesmis priestleyi Ana TaxID=1666911 RepID=A0A0P7YZ81_9CYAN|nr:MAG: GntR family transcriptional regulator [Phormidesmis priestleyi Ana]
MASVPLHISISEKLRDQIASGVYAPGEKLPSEHQMMAAFGVSRITVRQAIANLVNQGLAQSKQGKGVFVTPQTKVAYSLSSPLVLLESDLAQKGIKLTFENISFKKVRPPENVRAILGLTEPSAYFQKKLLSMNGSVGAVDITYILPELGQQFGPQLKRKMTFPVLEENAIAIERIEATIECTHADYEMSGHLEVPLGQPLIVYRYTAYSNPDKPILQGETISRADRFCYALTVKRSAP